MLEQKTISDKKINQQPLDFMRKVAIIGSPGAGKTTLAKNMNRILKIKIYHLDRLLWKTRWQSIDRPTRIDTMESVIRENQWIIEGMYIDSSVPRLNEADTIIFLDTPIIVCLWRVIWRHYKDRGQFRRDIPEQSVDKLNPRRIYKLLVFPIQDRKKLKQKLRTYKDKQIIRLQSSNEVAGFLAQLEHKVNKLETLETEKDRGLVSTM